jgi:Lar family restriction alleviation protein
MSDEIKRCPFCGALPRTEVSVTKMGGMEDHVDFSIHCTNCGVSKTVRLKIVAYANFIDVDKAESDVINAWNQRAEEEDE